MQQQCEMLNVVHVLAELGLKVANFHSSGPLFKIL